MTTTRPFVTAIAAGAVLAAVLAAAPAQTAPRGTPLATVDLQRVIDKVTERAELEVQLNALVKRIQDEQATRRRALDEGAKKLKDMKDPERTELRDQLALQDLQLSEWTKMKYYEVDRERSLMWQSIYRNIRAECAKLADSEGYELVLVNDGANEVQPRRDDKRSPEAQVLEQIERRRVLYAAKTVDVTDKLILRMNNARSTAPKADAPAAGDAK